MPSENFKGIPISDLQRIAQLPPEEAGKELLNNQDNYYSVVLYIQLLREKLFDTVKKADLAREHVSENHYEKAKELWDEIQVPKRFSSVDELIVLLDAHLAADGKTYDDLGISKAAVENARKNWHLDKARILAQEILQPEVRHLQDKLEEVDRHLLIAGQDRKFVGLSDNLIQEKLVENLLRLAKSDWKSACDPNDPVGFVANLVSMNETLARVAKTKTDIGISDAEFRKVCLQKAKAHWAKFCVPVLGFSVIEQIDDVKLILMAAGKELKDIGITDEDVSHVLMLAAKNIWDDYRANKHSRHERYSDVSEVIKEINFLLEKAGKTRTQAGITDEY